MRKFRYAYVDHAWMRILRFLIGNKKLVTFVYDGGDETFIVK